MLDFHEIEDVHARPNEKQLHYCVVDRHKVRQQVEVARHKDDGVEQLAVERDARGGPCGYDFEQQNEDRRKVQQVGTEAEYVHVGIWLSVGLQLRGRTQRARAIGM